MTDKKKLKIIEQLRLRIFSKSIVLMNRAELSKEFGTKGGKIVLVRLLRNLIWQSHQNKEKIKGNLRSFWYKIKPTVFRTGQKFKKDPYEVLLREFESLVRKGLMRYSDFDFADENWEYRVIGNKNPEVIVISEKTGLYRALKSVSEDLDFTIVATGGQPSFLSSEYLYNELPQKDNLVILAIVDWDPAGRIIAESFVRNLKDLGAEKVNLIYLITPKLFTPEELKYVVYPLPKKEKTKNENWLKKCGGINGKLLGIEADAVDYQRLKEIIRENVSQTIRRRR